MIQCDSKQTSPFSGRPYATVPNLRDRSSKLEKEVSPDVRLPTYQQLTPKNPKNPLIHKNPLFSGGPYAGMFSPCDWINQNGTGVLPTGAICDYQTRNAWSNTQDGWVYDDYDPTATEWYQSAPRAMNRFSWRKPYLNSQPTVLVLQLSRAILSPGSGGDEAASRFLGIGRSSVRIQVVDDLVCFCLIVCFSFLIFCLCVPED